MRQSTAERQLTLLAAGTAARRAAAREVAGHLDRAIDWPMFAETLRARRLLPTLGPRVVELLGGDADARFRAMLDDALEACRRQAVLLQTVCTRVRSALAAAGIPSATLKGPSLAETLYGDPGRRLSGDVDLLVAPNLLRRAVEVVRSLGYRPPDDQVESNGLPVLHFALVHGQQALPPVELHWRVHWYEEAFAQERLIPSQVDDSLAVWRPALADELAGLLLFYARDGFIDLRLATDLGAWWDAFGSQLRPGALDEHLERYPTLARALAASARVAEVLIGLPAEQLMRQAPKVQLRDRIALRMANPNPRVSARQLYADRGLVDGLLMPPGEFSMFVRRQVFPRREVLEAHASLAAKPRLRGTLGHPGRLLARCGILGRYGRTMARVARSPEGSRLSPGRGNPRQAPRGLRTDP